MALKSSRLWLVSPFWRPYVGLTLIASCDVGRSTQVHDTSDCNPCSCRLELEPASQGPAQETAGCLEFLWACRLIQVAFCVGGFFVLGGGGASGVLFLAPKGSKYRYRSYLLGMRTPKVYMIPVLPPPPHSRLPPCLPPLLRLPACPFKAPVTVRSKPKPQLQTHPILLTVYTFHPPLGHEG